MISSLYIGLFKISFLAFSKLTSPLSIVRTLSETSVNDPSCCITKGISTKVTTESTSCNLFISSLSSTIFSSTGFEKRLSFDVKVTNKNSFVE